MYVKQSIVNKWITKAIIVSRNKLRFLYNIKRSMNLPMKSIKYIQNYQLIYRKVIKEAKRRDADRLIFSAKNKNKALWKIINKENGNSHHVSNITINTRAKIITNPQTITERFNIYFTEVTEDILSQVNYHCPQQYLQFQIKSCSETMFVAPVTETEVEQVIKDLKNNSSPGFDEIPTSLVKQCLCHFIKPLVHIYNVSLQTGIFPDMMKKAKINPLFKKGDRQDIKKL